MFFNFSDTLSLLSWILSDKIIGTMGCHGSREQPAWCPVGLLRTLPFSCRVRFFDKAKGMGYRN